MYVYVDSCVYETKSDVVAHHKYWILITVLVDLSKWSRVATLSLSLFLSLLFQCRRAPTVGWRHLSFHLCVFPPSHNSPLFPSPSFTLPLSLPAVRDNYFQTSGPLGEAVLSKAAFIKNSRSCVDVVTLRWRERKRDGKSDKRDTKRERESNSNPTWAGTCLCPDWDYNNEIKLNKTEEKGG